MQALTPAMPGDLFEQSMVIDWLSVRPLRSRATGQQDCNLGVCFTKLEGSDQALSRKQCAGLRCEAMSRVLLPRV